MTPIVDVLDVVVTLLIFAIFGRAILSWFVRDPSHPLLRLLIDVTEPILGPIRRRLPQTIGFDLSPLIASIVIGGLWWQVIRPLAM